MCGMRHSRPKSSISGSEALESQKTRSKSGLRCTRFSICPAEWMQTRHVNNSLLSLLSLSRYILSNILYSVGSKLERDSLTVFHRSSGAQSALSWLVDATWGDIEFDGDELGSRESDEDMPNDEWPWRGLEAYTPANSQSLIVAEGFPRGVSELLMEKILRSLKNDTICRGWRSIYIFAAQCDGGALSTETLVGRAG
jgi:hypothetical protein